MTLTYPKVPTRPETKPADPSPVGPGPASGFKSTTAHAGSSAGGSGAGPATGEPAVPESWDVTLWRGTAVIHGIPDNDYQVRVWGGDAGWHHWESASCLVGV